MSPKTLRRLRSFHRWVGLFFAPMVLLFAFTGTLQVLDADDWPWPAWAATGYEALEDAHQDARLRRGTSLRPAAETLTAALGLLLCITTLAGIALALRLYPRQRRRTLVVLAIGVVLPLFVWLV